MRIRFVLVAEAANTTADGMLNVLGVFDRLHVREFPARHPIMDVVISTEFEENDEEGIYPIDLTIDGPNDYRAVAVHAELHVEKRNDTRYFNMLLPLPSVKFEEQGMHTITVTVGETVERYNIEVIKLETASGTDGK